MFYTIERTHPSMWKEHNLMFLLILNLQVLRIWLRIGHFPHYIIEEVNLFDGKLSKCQQRRLLNYVDFLIQNSLHDLFNIDIDNLGCRLQACNIVQIGHAGNKELSGECLRNSISVLLQCEFLRRLLFHLRTITNEIHTSNTTFQQDITNKLRTVFEYSTNAKLKTVALEYINHLYALHNSMQASKCLRQHNSALSEFIMRFKYSLNTDVASSRLKLASTLYCFGHLHAAIIVLEDVEKRYHGNVKAVCGCRGTEVDSDLQVFAYMISDYCDSGFREPSFTFCVKFVRQEAYCAPNILWFEMNRHMTEEEVAQRYYTDKQWVDCAEVDALPFLHYLEYLTYGGLGIRDKQLHALGIIESYICDPRNIIKKYHPETAQ